MISPNQKLPPSDYQNLIDGAETIEQDAYGDKVYLLADGRYLKLFRTKRFFSSATLFPHAIRFQRNADKLAHLKIPTVQVESVFHVPHIKRHAVLYFPLAGDTLRHYLKQQIPDKHFFFQLGEFLAHLHRNGVFFRSLHFGNIIVTPQHHFGLIDVSDMQISRFPLHYFKRLRNFKHFLRIKEDIQLLPQDSDQSRAIEQGYLESSGIRNQLFQKALFKVCQRLKGLSQD